MKGQQFTKPLWTRGQVKTACNCIVVFENISWEGPKVLMISYKYTNQNCENLKIYIQLRCDIIASRCLSGEEEHWMVLDHEYSDNKNIKKKVKKKKKKLKQL
jgi:hypothetical protein